MKNHVIQYEDGFSTQRKSEMEPEIKDFIKRFSPEEKSIYLVVDKATDSVFCECHINAKCLIDLSTVDVPLDPEEQLEYRANREIEEDDSAFQTMKKDALRGRSFSNIVAEYNRSFDTEHPLKIVGGQHRVKAIEEALSRNVAENHGIKVYFGLDVQQRLDVQLISNTNIDVSRDLLDRMMETANGPELRVWCQEVGFLEKGKDFADKKKRGGRVTVRDARTFISNYYLGKTVECFDKEKTDGIIAKTGGENQEWNQLKEKHPELWSDKALITAGKEYTKLANAQVSYSKTNSGKHSSDIAEKAYNYAIIASWAFIAGVLQNNRARLKRHYGLSSITKTDPLNSDALSKARHKSDPENYRGLGARTDAKERGRLVELFYLQAEKGNGIDKHLIDLAMTKHFAKQANLDVAKAEEKVK